MVVHFLADSVLVFILFIGTGLTIKVKDAFRRAKIVEHRFIRRTDKLLHNLHFGIVEV